MKGISALYILDRKGKILVTRAYRNDVPHNSNDIFNQKIIEFDEFNTVPVFMHKDYVFVFIKHENITFLAVATRNCNAMMVVSFLTELKKILIQYFKELEAESIRDNFIMIYELFDEIMDNGFPQITDMKILKQSIKTKHHELQKKDSKKKQSEAQQSVNNATPWRPGVYKYKKNEAYLDVIEKVNMLVGSGGQVIKSEVEGCLRMRCYLTGTPDLVLGLNDKKFFEMNNQTTKRRVVDIEDIKFHQCVRLGKFEDERTITFVPPDGEFDLITYRMSAVSKPLFTVNIDETHKSDTRLDFTVTANTLYRNKISATFVEFFIPVPPDSQNIKTKGTSGVIKYEPDSNSLRWRLKMIKGKKEIKLKCSLSMPLIKTTDYEKYRKRPVSVQFEIPYYTLSGINVRYLKIREKSGYNALSWVRYLAKNGEVNIRMRDTL
jgi:AP-1 complex subunit mu